MTIKDTDDKSTKDDPDMKNLKMGSKTGGGKKVNFKGDLYSKGGVGGAKGPVGKKSSK